MGIQTALLLFFAAVMAGQQLPFVPVSGPNAPKGAVYPFEDGRGGLWLGGAEGGKGRLTYFDGSRFLAPVSGPFPKGDITGMAEDGDGGLWIASNGGLLRLQDGRLDKVMDGEASMGVLEVAPGILLSTVVKPGTPRYQAARLVRVMKAGGAWKAETIWESFSQSRFQADRAGNILYVCPGGYCEFRGDAVARWKVGEQPPVSFHSLRSPPGANVALSAFRDSIGCIWIHDGSSVWYQCPGDLRPTALPPRIANRGSNVIAEMEDGSVVIASFGQIAIGRPGKFRVITGLNGHPSSGPWMLADDGSIWMSGSNGLVVFPPHSGIEFWTEREGLGGNTWSVLPLKEKTFAIAGEEVRVLDADRSRWLSLAEVPGAVHLSAGPGKTLFASTMSNGVVQLDWNGHVLRRSEAGNAMMLAETPDGQTWVSGGEVAKVTVSGSRLKLLPATIPAVQGGGFDMKVDGNGRLWTCTYGGLLYGKGSDWHAISKKDGLRDNPCLSLATDRDGDIWYGYTAPLSGFSLIQDPAGTHRRFRYFPEGADVGAGVAHFFGSDKRGWLWRGTPNGVYVADIDQASHGQWLLLNRTDGLPGVDTNQRSFVADDDGSVWFGIDNSVVHVSPPADLVRPSHSPRVFISGFSWNGGAFQMAETVKDIESGARITAHIGSLQFDRRNALRLRYRLLPEQSSWKAEQALDIDLGKLGWGTHRLEVQARLGAGPWSSSVVKSFTVLRPLWLSWPFVLGCFAAGGVAAAGGYLRRKRRLQRAHMRLPELSAWRIGLFSPDLAKLEGSMLDERFKILAPLASGGFGTVFCGSDLKQEGKPCAVKIFRRELRDKSWMSKRFEQEVSALRRTSDRNVVGIYGSGVTPGGAFYLAMELIEGRTLRTLLDEGRLHRLQTASYLRQTASALSAIHARGICHRDVKPENLMIRNTAPPGEELVLIDFSIAIVQDPDETMHGLSRAAGTLYYMAPEQAIGYADASSDIYSLAKTLIEMLTGERLSSLLPDASMDLSIRVRELLAQLPLGLSVGAIDLIAAALEFDPARRPKVAGEFGARICRDLESDAENR